MQQDGSADPEALLAALADANVVDDDGESVRLTDDFRERRRRVRAELVEEDESPVPSAVEAACEAVATEVDDDLLASAVAVDEATDLDPEGVAAAALALGRIESPPDDAGAPEDFTPIRGEEIEAFLARHPTAVIYFWGYDCEPCDTLKDDLETLREEGRIPDEVELAAVCGDDCYELIRERYDVGVAPTTLFCTDGRVDSRLIGPHNPETYVSEIEIIAGT